MRPEMTILTDLARDPARQSDVLQMVLSFGSCVCVLQRISGGDAAMFAPGGSATDRVSANGGNTMERLRHGLPMERKTSGKRAKNPMM